MARWSCNDAPGAPRGHRTQVPDAYHAHYDRAKRQRLRGLGILETMLTRQVFLGFVMERASVATQVAAVVRLALRDGRYS